MPEHVAAALPADDLIALCAACHDGLTRARRKNRDQASQIVATEALF
ncbi:hypothetical protein [Nonomuraea dietziae]